MAAASRWRTTVLMNLASIVERADEQVLPAVYRFISISLHATPSQLGTLTLCRAMVQAISSPISGFLGDKYDRTHIVAFGCCLWGVMTAAIGMSNSVQQAMVWCGVNGIGLALVIPCVQSLIADYHPSESRGRAFGFMFFTSSLGGMLGGFFATNVGHFRPLGIEGWRFAFHFVAAISLVVCLLVLRYAADPRKKGLISPLMLGERRLVEATEAGKASSPPKLPGHSPSLKSLTLAGRQPTGAWMGGRLREMWGDVMSVLRIPTFQIIILQGIVGSTPWNAMVFFTMWLQLLGFTDFTAAMLMATFATGCALGSFAGGIIGDYMGRVFPASGRVLTCQFSVMMGLPLSCLVLKGLPNLPAGGQPAGQALTLTYAAALFIMGLSVSWCGTNNSAFFADIVPEQKRSTVYAFDRSFEGAVAACAAPLVGSLAERMFGYDPREVKPGGVSHDAENAAALSSSLLVCLLVPWTLCFLFYFGLYRTYPRDRMRKDRPSNAFRVMEP